VNPPSSRIRRCGEGAQYVGDLRSDARRHQLMVDINSPMFAHKMSAAWQNLSTLIHARSAQQERRVTQPSDR
jgi:hypothetical protein